MKQHATVTDLLKDAYDYATGEARNQRNADHPKRHGLMSQMDDRRFPDFIPQRPLRVGRGFCGAGL
jgi:hypothetical protein